MNPQIKEVQYPQKEMKELKPYKVHFFSLPACNDFKTNHFYT